MTAYWTHPIGGGLHADHGADLYLGTTGRESPLGFILTARTARELAAALIAAASDKEASLPNRCRCGDAIEQNEAECVHCDIAARHARRASLRILD